MTEILQSNSVFRNIPKWLPSDKRYFFEGIGISIEMAGCAYRRLRALAQEAAGANSAKLDWKVRADLFDAAWGFVGHVHMLNQLLWSLPGRRPEGVSEFLQDSAPVRNLRNHYQHLHQNIKNRIAKKGNVMPAVGVLYWVEVTSSDPPTFKSHIHTSGMLRERWTYLQSPNPVTQEIEYPVGAFRIEAFEEHLDISKTYRDIQQVLDAFENDIHPAMFMKIEEAERESGEDLSGLRESAGGPLDATVDIEAPGYEVVQQGWVK